MAGKKNDDGGVVRRCNLFAVLDMLAANIATASGGEWNVAAGGNVHQALMSWLKDHPEEADVFRTSYVVIKQWDEASRPKVDREKGQRAFDFYEPFAAVPTDAQGTRRRLGELQLEGLNAWWEVQVEDDRRHRKAHSIKRAFYSKVRSHLQRRGSKATVHEIMTEVYGWTGESGPADDTQEDMDFGGE